MPAAVLRLTSPARKRRNSSGEKCPSSTMQRLLLRIQFALFRDSIKNKVCFSAIFRTEKKMPPTNPETDLRACRSSSSPRHDHYRRHEGDQARKGIGCARWIARIGEATKSRLQATKQRAGTGRRSAAGLAGADLQAAVRIHGARTVALRARARTGGFSIAGHGLRRCPRCLAACAIGGAAKQGKERPAASEKLGPQRPAGTGHCDRAAAGLGGRKGGQQSEDGNDKDATEGHAKPLSGERKDAGRRGRDRELPLLEEVRVNAP
jgi:hypothetical protein